MRARQGQTTYTGKLQGGCIETLVGHWTPKFMVPVDFLTGEIATKQTILLQPPPIVIEISPVLFMIFFSRYEACIHDLLDQRL